MSERLRVLLVEDNPADVDLIRETLPETGPVSFLLECVSRLTEARARVASGDLDLILLDLGLPDSQGLATFHALKAAAPDIPTVVLTGNDDEEAAIAAVKQGAQDYLIKGQVVGNMLARAARYAVERKRGEDALRASHERFRLANLATFNAIWDWDLQTDALWWNENFQTIFGYAAEEIEPGIESWKNRIHPEDLDRVTAGVHAAIDSGRQFWSNQYRFRRKDGSYAVVDDRGYIARTPDGIPVRMIGAMQDVSERKRAEDELSASEDRYRTLFGAIDEGFCIVEVIFDEDEKPIDYRFLEVNPSFEKQTGLVDAQGKRMRELAPKHEEHWFEIYGRIAVTGEAARFVNRAEQLHRWYDGYAFRVGQPKDRRVAILFNDITERMRTEEALRESEALLSATEELAGVGGWEWDVEAQSMTWTAQLYRIHDIPPGDIASGSTEHIDRSVQCYRPEDRPTVLQAFRRCAQTGEPYDLEVPFTTFAGRRLWIRTTARAVQENGKIVRVVGNVVDITERKRAEEALRKSERAFRETLRHLDEAYYSVTADGLILDHNLAFNRIHGIDAGEDLRGRHVPDLWQNPDDRRAYLDELMANGVVRNYLVDVKTASGEKRAVLLNAHLEKDEQGGLVRIIGTMTDISELKRGEERIIHLNRILRAIRDINQLIVRERDRDRLIEDACRLLVESRGYGVAMVVLTDAAGVPRAWAEAGMGDSFQPLSESLRRGVLPPCCRLAQQHEGVYHVSDPTAVCVPCPIWAKSASTDSSCIRLRYGETTFGYLSVSVERALGVDTEEDSLLAEVAGDVAYALHGIERAEAMTRAEEDRDRAEGQLRQSQKMEAVGRLAGGVAHDFNNILTVIITSCSFLEEGLLESEPLLEDVRTIHASSQSAARLTRQLLAFSRRQVLEPQPLDLNALVAESEKMLGRLIGEDIVIRIEAAPALDLVLADPGQFEQVIVNLAVNARDAMPDGGTLTIATANVELDEVFVSRHVGSSAGPHVRLAVTDTGVGMDAEILARVFEPFFTTKEVGRGTGLGLSTVYGIVKQSGGYVTADSAPGSGATFEIFLPRVASVARPWRPPGDASSPGGRGETILLVEDNDQLRAVATRALAKLGYRVFGAAGLDEASRIAATEGPIHLLLTDVVMPGGSGRDVSIAVATAHPAVRVLYMSGFTDDAIVQRGVLEPGVAFLHKPFGRDELGRKVREVLDG